MVFRFFTEDSICETLKVRIASEFSIHTHIMSKKTNIPLDPSPTEIHEDINSVNVATYANQAYLDYAMSVVCGRAIPYLEDGQKPVQRRTLFAMNEMRLSPEGKPVKSAKIIGNVLGSYHPHGDQSVYDAMVRQTQSFVMRYPLVHGEGNFGSRDGDGAAAMRYCFAAGTRVMSDRGLLKIESIPETFGHPSEFKGEIGTHYRVNSLKNTELALKWLYSGVQPTFEVLTKHGYSVTCTGNEPLYVLNPTTLAFDWRTVDSLKIGEAVALNRRNLVDVRNYKSLPLSNGLRSLGVPTCMSYPLARFLGLLMGSAMMDLDTSGLIHLSGSAFVRGEIFSLGFGLFPKHFPPLRTLSIDDTPTSLDSPVLLQFLSEIGQDVLPLSAQLRLPEVVFQSSALEVRGFLAGLFQNSKTTTHSAIVSDSSTATASELLLALPHALISDVKSLLLNYFGCVSSAPLPISRHLSHLIVYDFGLDRSLNSTHGVLPPAVIHTLKLQGIHAPSVHALKQHLSTQDQPDPKLVDITQCDYFYDPIVAIRPAPLQHVYDLTVANTHAFVANGFVAHNTEAKLSTYAKHLLKDLHSETVDFRPNYDGTTTEPNILPARLPFILMNGAEGVGVGMACSIPPHRASELTQAAVTLLKNPDASFEDVMSSIEGPDFPTGGQLIQSRDKILSVYKEGNGTLKLRGAWTVETGARGAWKLVLSQLPYGVSAQRIMEQVDGLVNPKPKEKGNKKEFSPDQLALKVFFGNMIDVYRDESDKTQPIRVVFEPKSNKQNPDDLVQALLTHTGLQDTIKFNFVVVGRDGRPGQMGIVAMLKEWGLFRVELTQRRLEHEQRAATRRLHIVEGRIKVLDAIQEAIRVIQASDDPKKGLMERFDLSEEQAQDVLDMRLRQLARLEGAALTKEKAELEKTLNRLKRLLAKRNELVDLVIQEIEEDVKSLGEDPRLTRVEAVADADEPASKGKTLLQMPEEPLTIAISEKFWVRAKSGLEHAAESFVFKTGDAVSALYAGSTRSQVFALDHTGRVYTLDASEVPNTRGGEGLPLSSSWDLQGKIQHAWVGSASAEEQYVLASDAGHGFVVSGQDLTTRLKAGKAALTLADGSLPLPLVKLPSGDLSKAYVVALSSDGSAVSFLLSELPVMGKGKGVALMGLRDGCKIVSLVITSEPKVGVVEQGKTKWWSGEDFLSFTGGRSSSKKGKKVVKTAEAKLLAPPNP
jgi:topoisomerase IV subunit A